MTAAIGSLAKLGIGSASPVTQALNFEKESFIEQDEVYNGNALRGSLSNDIGLMRDGIKRVSGSIGLQPTSLEWTYLLQWILGGTPTGSPTVTYPLADGAPVTKYLTIDRRQKVFTYAGVAVEKASIRATRGTCLTCDLDCVGQTSSTGAAGSFPAISLDVSTEPLVFTDLTLSIGGTTVAAFDFNLEIENRIDRDRFLNSLTLTAINKLERTIKFSTRLPYGDYQAIQAAMTAGPTIVAVVATFTNGGASMVFTMPAISAPLKEPSVPGREEITFDFAGTAKRTSGSLELVTTLNPGP